MHSSPFKSLVLACAIATLTACGGAENTSQQTSDSTNPAPENPQLATKDVSFRLDVSKALNAGVSATRAEVRVFNDLLERSSSADIADQAASISFTALPLGSYSIEVKVFDGTTLIATGTGSAQVSANDTTAVNLLVNPVTGNLDVAICMPDIATQYFNGTGTGTLVHQPDGNNIDDDDQPAAQAYHAAFDGVADIRYDFRVGDGALANWSAEHPTALVTDHGASLQIRSGENLLLDLSGCNTRLMVEKGNNQFSLWYALPQVYDKTISVKSNNLEIGTIEADALAMVIRFIDTDGDAAVAGAATLSDIDFSKFERQSIMLGVPLPTAFTGMADLIFTGPEDLLGQRFYFSSVE